MFVIGLVSRFMQKPPMHHFGTIERIMHYVSGTVKLGLKYEHVPNFKLTGFVDSNWMAPSKIGGVLSVGYST